MPGYRFDNAWERERERLTCLEVLYDPSTIRYLGDLGVGGGWRCLEIGAGAGSIAAWLCDRVGSEGQVVATDLDTRFVSELRQPQLEVLTHDVNTDDRPGQSFDLIHARLLLEWVRDPDAVLKRLATWLTPGGWLVVEDFQWSARYAIGASTLFDETTRRCIEWLVTTGYKSDYGGRLCSALEAQGLVDVGSEGRSVLVRGASPSTAFYRLSIEQLRAPLTASGIVTDAQVDDALERLADPAFTTMMPCLVSAWGRLPH